MKYRSKSRTCRHSIDVRYLAGRNRQSIAELNRWRSGGRCRRLLRWLGVGRCEPVPVRVVSARGWGR